MDFRQQPQQRQRQQRVLVISKRHCVSNAICEIACEPIGCTLAFSDVIPSRMFSSTWTFMAFFEVEANLALNVFGEPGEHHDGRRKRCRCCGSRPCLIVLWQVFRETLIEQAEQGVDYWRGGPAPQRPGSAGHLHMKIWDAPKDDGTDWRHHQNFQPAENRTCGSHEEAQAGWLLVHSASTFFLIYKSHIHLFVDTCTSNFQPLL